jgi:hypothetical protein
MIESNPHPHPNPDRPGPGDHPDHPAPPISLGPVRMRGFALRISQIRNLAACIGLYQTATLYGVWMYAGGDAPRTLAIAGGTATLIAMALAFRFRLDAHRGGDVTSAERSRAILLAVNPALPAIPIIVMNIRTDHAAIPTSVTAMFCVLIFHTAPGLVLANAFARRIGHSDSAWTPHLATGAARSAALLGLSIYSGGWCAALGWLAFLATHELNADIRAEQIVLALGSSNFALAFGMVLGFVACIFTTTIPARTRLDRSVFPLFAIPITVGMLGSALDPFIGVGAASLAVLGACGYVSAQHTLTRPGFCERCEYSLAGLSIAVCPECGHHNTRRVE